MCLQIGVKCLTIVDIIEQNANQDVNDLTPKSDTGYDLIKGGTEVYPVLGSIIKRFST
jgi:hypothetical protein